MKTIHLAAAILAVWLVTALAAPARADIPGTYTTTQEVRGGSIKYTLNLRDNGNAELVSERKDYPRLDRGNIQNYGDILNTLERYGKVRHVGTWQRRRDRNRDFAIDFERMYFGSENTFESMNSRGTVDRDRLTLDNWRPSLYGRETEFSFSRSKGRRNNDAIIAGAAVLALGAIIASSNRHSGSSSFDIKELDYETGGRGSYRVEGRNPVNIQSVQIVLRRNGSARIGITLGGDGFYLDGRWSRGSGKTVKVDITRAFDNERMRGGGTITLRNAREIEKMDLQYINEADGAEYRISFTAARG